MKNGLVMARYVFIIGGILLNSSGAWASSTEAVVTTNDKSIADAPAPLSPVTENPVWNVPKGSGWEKRIFDKPLSPYNFPKNQFRLPKNSGIPLKSPGMLPGIEFGVEMHSFQALQSIVPPESLSKSFSFQQNQPVLLAPSNISSDYNAGFLRFIW